MIARCSFFNIALTLTTLLLALQNNSFAQAENSIKSIEQDYYLLFDPDLNEVLLANNHLEPMAPSSMTKLMTAYIVFEQIEQRKIALDDYCLIGKDAWNKYGSTMFLDHGDLVQISDLLKGLLVMSGNDAAIALAQTTTRSGYDNFIDAMNYKATELGMFNTHFTNPHGLNEDGHYSTLFDLAILIKKLYEDFPQYTHFLELDKFEFNGISQKSRNPLIKNSYDGALGGKTGYTNDGGYGVAALVKRNHRRLIAVVNKMPTPKARAKKVTELLDYGFNSYKKIVFFNKGEIVTSLSTWLGYDKEVKAFIDQDVILNIPSQVNLDDIKIEVDYLKPIYAPITQGDKIAHLHISIDGYGGYNYPLFAKHDVVKIDFFDKVKLILNDMIVKKSLLLN